MPFTINKPPQALDGCSAIDPNTVQTLANNIAHLDKEQYITVDRQPQRGFGHADRQPNGNIRNIVQGAAGAQQIADKTGRSLHVCPTTITSDQTMYLGYQTQKNRQEIHRAELLNANMQIHDPSTGQPGRRVGHLFTQLLAAPLISNRHWPLEVPRVSPVHVNRYRESTQLDAQRRAVSSDVWTPKTRLTGNPKNNAECSEAIRDKNKGGTLDLGERALVPFRANYSKPSAIYHYLTHPAGQPPKCDTSRMTVIGSSTNSQVVLQVDVSKEGTGIVDPRLRPATPRLPWVLLTE
ncbi:hypothetical protein K438DRAFT_1785649 [Mycena galopus ATCC 62051]|nr:hypothetical protein K438DRAFT_1785649 [Mycena galopus ATCC 62051]